MADAKVIKFLNDNIQLLKRNDFDTLFSKADKYFKGNVFDFIINELGIDPLRYMTYIPKHLFFSSENTKAVTIPNNITKIESFAFSGDSIQEVKVTSSNLTLERAAFYSCNNLQRIIFEEGINKIPSECFENCGKLKLVEFPSSLTAIGTDAFQNVSNDIVIIVPYKTENRLRIPRSDVPWYKEHLKHRHSSQENAKLNVNADEANSAVED